jgi:hypothetical protein
MKITVRDVAFIVTMGFCLILFLPIFWASSLEYNQKLNASIGIIGVIIGLILVYYFVLRKLKVNGLKVAGFFFIVIAIILIILSVWIYFDTLKAFGQVNTYFLIGETAVGLIPYLLAGSLILLYNHYKSRHKLLMRIEKIVWAIIIILFALFLSGILSTFVLTSLPFESVSVEPIVIGFGEIQVLNPSLAEDGTLILTIENRVGFDTISVTSVNATISNWNIGWDISGGSNIPPYLFNSSNSRVITGIVTSGTWANLGATTGASYNASITIYYDYQGQTFSSSGTVSGTYS